jgi:hypothetical protein
MARARKAAVWNQRSGDCGGGAREANGKCDILVDVEEAGKVERWSFEGPPPGFFRQRNVDRPAFEASKGKSVTVEASRARNGSASGSIRQVTLSDGTVVSACPQNC